MRKKIVSTLIISSIFIFYYFYPPNLIYHFIAIIIYLLSLLFSKYRNYFFILKNIISIIDPYTTIWISFYIKHQFYIPFFSIIILFLNPQSYTVHLILFYFISSITYYYENELEYLLDSYILKRDKIKKENISLHHLQNQIILSQQEEKAKLLSEERNRISLELHDQSGHSIAGTIMQISMLKSKEKDPMKYKILSDIQENLAHAMANIRSILHNEIILNDIDKELLKLKQLYSSLNSEINISIREKLSEFLVNHLSSITKEAYTNTIKHTNAKNVFITLIESDSYYIYSYKDDGKEKIQKEIGIGLYSMQVRSNKMKAKLTLMDDYSIHIRIPKGVDHENILY